MRELTRSNDPVLLSALTSALDAEGIEAVVLDSYGASVMAPLNMTAEQRVMVADEAFWPAWTVFAELEGMVTEDAVLGGRVSLLQPVAGFRAAIDPLLLAAAVPAGNGDRVLDVGTGTGAAALALLARRPWAWVTGIDVQPDLIALARRAAERNDVAARTQFRVADVAKAASAGTLGPFEHVMSNPPFLAADAGQRPADPARARATVEGSADLAAWLDFMVTVLADGGTLTLIHRHDRLDEIARHLTGLGVGALRVLELVPVDDGRPLKRAIVQGARGAPAAGTARRRLVLHRADGGFTTEAEAILRDAAALPMSSGDPDARA